jgi:tetratricopeptide (TPR) repeat protein
MSKSSIELTKQKELWLRGYNLLAEKKFKEAEKMLLSALQEKDSHPIHRHFIYNALIDLYYRLRNERKDALDKCIYYCKEDIQTLPEFLRYWREEYPNDINLPLCPSLVRLSIIYENKGELIEAIDVCKNAIALGLQDGTKNGFEGRLIKLQKKKVKATP